MIVNFNGNTFEIKIEPKPNNCKECPFLRHYMDDEYSGFDIDYCMFDHKETFGSYVNRPSDCPLDIAEPHAVIDLNKII